MKNKSNKSNKSHPNKRYKITIFILSMIAIISLAATIFIYTNHNKKGIIVASSMVTSYTSEELSSLIDSSITNANEEMLVDMKSKLSSGTSALSLIRDFYPKNVVYYDTDKYIFASILDSVPKNTLIAKNFSVDATNEITYSENGAVISHKGIDVSKYQGDIDWTKVKNSNVEYAFLRTGYRSYGAGLITPDTSFKQNIQGASNAGIGIGVYFYSQAINTTEATEEAQYVLDQIKGYNVNYPIVLDVEEILNDTFRQQNLTTEELTTICITFCEKIKAAGYTPMIYSNLKYYVAKLNLEKLTSYEKWYASYDTSLYFPYDISMWQYSQSGTVDGITGNVDLNISFKKWK